MSRRKFIGSSPTARAVSAETGNRDAVQGTVQLAEGFTRDCGVTHGARSLDILASFLDARIERSAMRSAGELVHNPRPDSEFLILVNQEHSRQRQNFSICHEFGHLLMPNYNPAQGRHVDLETMRWNAEEEEEYLCDIASAEILMPRRVFGPRLRACGLSSEALNVLAEEFDASLEATAVNMVRANQGDVAVIVWKWGYNLMDAASAANMSLFSDSNDPALAPVEKKHRVKFAVGCGAMREFYCPPNKSVDNDSLIATAANRLQEGTIPRTVGMQKLFIGKEEREFFTDSYAYWTRNDGILEPKIISFVFPDDRGRVCNCRDYLSAVQRS